MTLSIVRPVRNAECRYGECHYADFFCASFQWQLAGYEPSIPQSVVKCSTILLPLLAYLMFNHGRLTEGEGSVQLTSWF